MKHIFEGLSILLKYVPEGSCCAEHDVLYAEGPQEVSPDDRDRLLSLGWRWDVNAGSWARFT